MRNIMLIIVFITPVFLYGAGQGNLENNSKSEFVFDFAGAYTPVLGKDFFGLSVDMKYYVIKKFATGINFSWAGKNISETYSYDVVKPMIDYYVIGWMNQYDFLQTNRIRAGVNVNNGLAFVQLADNSIKDPFYYITEYGYFYGQRSKKIALSYLYILEPGIDLSVRIFSKNRFPDIYLSSKTKYRFAFGDSKFGETSQFSNYYFGVGISFVGLM